MLLKTIDQGSERDRYLPLLLLADDSEQQVRGYMQDGLLFVAEVDGRDAGIGLGIPFGQGALGLKAGAVGGGRWSREGASTLLRGTRRSR